MLLAKAALALLAAVSCRAWDNHQALTALALRDLPALDASVPVETLDAYLSSAGRLGGAPAFLRALKVNPATRFPFRAGETPGAAAPLRAVVAAYADEPDWGLDQSLFDAYPELWKDDYRYMGGRSGPQTRAFRHMYWPGGFYREPPPGSQKPVLDPTALGEAPERCALFFGLAREAFAAGHPYWGARFLAWSLHYLEDAGQPFHATQLPTARLLRLAPGGKTIDLEKTTRTVAYYHLAVDGYPSHAGGALQARVTGGLVGVSSATFAGADALAREGAAGAARAARALAEAALDFFPDPDDGALADPLGRVYSPSFWNEVQNGAAADPQGSEGFLAAVDARLSDTAGRARALTLEALSAVPAPAPPRRDLARAFRKLLTWPSF